MKRSSPFAGCMPRFAQQHLGTPSRAKARGPVPRVVARRKRPPSPCSTSRTVDGLPRVRPRRTALNGVTIGPASGFRDVLDEFRDVLVRTPWRVPDSRRRRCPRSENSTSPLTKDQRPHTRAPTPVTERETRHLDAGSRCRRAVIHSRDKLPQTPTAGIRRRDAPTATTTRPEARRQQLRS